MISSKKRHEFRIKLQKRARQRLEKRIETFREDYDLLQVGGPFLNTLYKGIMYTSVYIDEAAKCIAYTLVAS